MQRHVVLAGTYCDSVVLMRLQQALEGEPGIHSAAAVMATPANREILEQGDLWSDELAAHRPDDLLVVVRAEDDAAAEAALGRVDELLRRRRESSTGERRYHGLAAALEEHPEARWVALSIPGEHAAEVTRQALEADRNVFLYSDNVSLADEVELKARAGEKGLLVLGPDCGSAILGGIGFGFSNRVEPGPVGLVGASGTGLQALSCRLAAAGVGIAQMIGTGGRDLHREVGGRTTRQALDLLARDPEVRRIGWVSKPPDPTVAARLLGFASGLGKPVVAAFVGARGGVQRLGSVTLTADLATAAELCAEEAGDSGPVVSRSSGSLLGLFAGGTLALEVGHALEAWLAPLGGNVVGEPADESEGVHRILDLGGDEYTVGRPHPMIDNRLRTEWIQRAGDEEGVGTLLLDVVLGYGGHPDPASELGPAIEDARERARRQGRELQVAVLLVGTDSDPQDLGRQRAELTRRGAFVTSDLASVLDWLGRRLLRSDAVPNENPVGSEALSPTSVIHLGLEGFADDLATQGSPVVRVDWRPPAGGDARLADILRRMKNRSPQEPR